MKKIMIILVALLSFGAMAQDGMPAHDSTVIESVTAGEYITEESANEMTQRYQANHFEEVFAHNVSVELINDLTSNSDVVELRIYEAINDKGSKTLVIIGVDSSGENTGKAVDNMPQTRCPPNCGKMQVFPQNTAEVLK